MPFSRYVIRDPGPPNGLATGRNRRERIGTGSTARRHVVGTNSYLQPQPDVLSLHAFRQQLTGLEGSPSTAGSSNLPSSRAALANPAARKEQKSSRRTCTPYTFQSPKIAGDRRSTSSETVTGIFRPHPYAGLMARQDQGDLASSGIVKAHGSGKLQNILQD